MSPKQKKLAAKAPPPNKIDAKDFAVLKAEKAKGRGMGLQDEKIKPGKVMKANKGRFSKIPLAGKATSVGSTTMKGMKFSDKAKMVDAGKINKATGKFTSMEALRESIGYRPGESTDKFNKRRMKLAGATKALKATKVGKIALGVGAAGVAASQYLKSKMNKKKDVKKKMGGGMMKKYSVGGGADSGKVGEMKSRIAVTVDRLKKAHKNTMGRRSGPMGNRLTDNDMEKIKNLVGKNKAARPMGYSKGGGYDSGTPGKVRDMLNSTVIKEKGKFAKLFGGKPTKRKMDELVEIGIPKVKKIITSKKYMGGGMIAQSQRPGYSKGTMVKARGCKLGRTRPTKIT